MLLTYYYILFHENKRKYLYMAEYINSTNKQVHVSSQFMRHCVLMFPLFEHMLEH